MESLVLMFVCAALLPLSSGINVSEIFTQTCPGDRGNLVTVEEWIEKIAVAPEQWILAKNYELNDPIRYVNCRHRWNPINESNWFLRETNCYNIDLGSCVNFTEVMRLTEDPCGRAVEVSADGNVVLTYFSRNLNLYMWFFVCYEWKEDGECQVGYIDLLVRESMLDEYGKNGYITGVATSLEQLYNFEFSTAAEDYADELQECPLD